MNQVDMKFYKNYGMNMNKAEIKEIIDEVKTQLAEENMIEKHFVKVNLPQELLEECIKKAYNKARNKW